MVSLSGQSNQIANTLLEVGLNIFLMVVFGLEHIEVTMKMEVDE